MVCPHETSMSIDLMAALDSEGKNKAGGGGGGVMAERMDG